MQDLIEIDYRSITARNSLDGTILWVFPLSGRASRTVVHNEQGVAPIALKGSASSVGPGGEGRESSSWDFDQDGIGDLIVEWYAGGSKLEVLKAVSGKTGRRIWKTLETKTYQQGSGTLLCQDLEGDGTSEFIYLSFSDTLLQSRIRKSWSGDDGHLVLSVMDAQTGRERWHRSLTREYGSNAGKRHSYRFDSIAMPRLAVTDINDDGVLDILAPSEPSMQSESQTAPPTTATWVALDGSNGNEIWNRPGTPCRDESNCFVEAAQVCAMPRKSQVMEPTSQTYLVDIRDQHSTKGGSIERKLQVAAVAARSGVELWNTSLDVDSGFRRNHSFGGDRLYSQAIQAPEGKSMLLVAYEHERKDYVHLFDHQGTTVAKQSFQQSTSHPKPPIVWDSFDRDGDGILDRILVGNPIAIVDLHRGLETHFELSNSSLVSASTSAEKPTLSDESLAIEVQFSGEPASPQIVLHARGEYPQVTGFDAIDGKRLWCSYGPTRHRTYSSDFASTQFIQGPNSSAPIVVYNNIDQSSARLATPEEGQLKKLDVPVLAGAEAKDIRFQRALPWLQNSMMTESPMEVLAFLATGLLQSLLLVWIPGAYLYLTIRKVEWSLRSLLMLPVVVAFVLIVLQFQQGNSGGTWIASFGMAFVFAPLSGLLGTLVHRCVQLRWREVLSIVHIIVIGALCTASIVLGVRSGTEPLDRGEYYDWSGWYWILPQSLFITAYLYFGWRMVQWLFQKKVDSSQ